MTESATCLLQIPGSSIAQLYEGERVNLGSGTLELIGLNLDGDLCLVIRLGEVEIPLTRDTTVYRQEASYIIPWADIPGALISVSLPQSSDSDSLRESFECHLIDYSILADKRLRNSLILLDEGNGQVVGQVEDLSNRVNTEGGANPVLIEVPDNGHVLITDAYKDSQIVRGADFLSRGVISASTAIGQSLVAGSEAYKQRFPNANTSNMQFSQTTKNATRRINESAFGAASVSSKTVARLTGLAAATGARLAGGKKATDTNKKPGFFNQTAVALVTVLDGIDTATKNIMVCSRFASNTLIDSSGTLKQLQHQSSGTSTATKQQ